MTHYYRRGTAYKMPPSLWLGIAQCRVAPLLSLVRHFLRPVLLLIWLRVSQAGLEPPDPGDCAGQQLPDRIRCGDDGIFQLDCHELGCCYDVQFHMCFFPVKCEQFATVAGGYSAVLLLPGKDSPHQGSMSMLEGGNWCSRDAQHGMGSLEIEIVIPEVRLVYLTTTYTGVEIFSHPFIFHYSQEKYKHWLMFYEPQTDTNVTGEESKFSHNKIVYTVYANRLKVQPKKDRGRPCVRVDVVTCPGVPATEEPENVTFETPTTVAPTEAPEMVKGVDERPTAIAVGSFVVIVFALLLAFFVLIDLPTYGTNLLYMKRSIESYLRYKRRKRALANGSACREKKAADGRAGCGGGGGGGAAAGGRGGGAAGDSGSTVSDELLLSTSSAAGFDISRDMEAQHALVHPELPDEIGLGDWLTESDDASLVQYETVF